MQWKAGIVLCILLVGSYAAPKPEDDLSMFYEHADQNARIVGGTTADQSRHRHMVALSSGTLIRSFLCGGSLVSSRTVITAAHCIAAVFSGNSLTNSLRGTVGTMRWNQGGTMYTFARNASHPNYVAATIKNDIGLLITTNNVVFTNVISVVQMDFNWQAGGVPVRVGGWGRIRNGGSLSTVLLELDWWTIDGDRCVREVAQASSDFNVRAPDVEPHIEICTFHSAGHGTCNGDSGSALVGIATGAQVGIVSWGFPCARGAPDMFVRLSAYRDWVLQNMA